MPVRRTPIVLAALAPAVLLLVTSAAVTSAETATGPAVTTPTTVPGIPTTLPVTPPTAAPASTAPGPTVATTPAPSTTALPDVGIVTLPPTTVTVPPSAPNEFAATPPLGIPLEVGGGPQYLPTVVLAPAGERGWQMFGDYRSNPGAVSQVVAYGAPAASPSAWGQSGFTGEEQPAAARDAEVLADGTTLVLGSVDDSAGPAATAWVYADGAFSDPEVVGPFAVPTRVTHAASSADGTVYAVVERYIARQSVGFDLARRAPDGTWTAASLEVPARNIGIYGIAVQGSTIVLTGDRGSASGVGYDAAAFTSVDGGATFRVADTAALAAPGQSTSINEVVPGGSGFVAAACLPNPGAPRAAIVQSADGVAWSELPFSGPDGFPLVGAGCSQLAVDADGGIWLGGATTFDATFYRVFGGAVDRLAVLEVDGQQGPIFEPSRLRFGVGPTTLAVSVPQLGGTAAAFVTTSATTDLAAPATLQPVGDAPVSHEIIRDVSVINDLGSVVAVDTFPFIPEGTGNYVVRSFPFQLSARGEPTADEEAAPVDPATGTYLDGIVSLPSGDVSLSDVVDPAGAQFVGVSGDIVVARRPPGGAWTTPELVLGGDGGQNVIGVTVVAGAVVGVAEDKRTNPQTGVDEGAAFVLVGDGTTFSRIDLAVGNSNRVVPLDVCAMPDNTALVVGYDGLTGRGFTATVDLAAATARINTPVIEPASAVATACHAAREGAIVEVSIGSVTRLYQTRDGVSFFPIDVLAADDSVRRVRTGAEGVAIVGVSGPAGEDAFALFGPTIEDLRRVEIDTFAGPGVQVASDVVITAGSLFVVGTINDSPVVWPITYG